MKAYFFGCWNESGHFWWLPDGQRLRFDEENLLVFPFIDGGYAPRRWKEGHFIYRHLVKNALVCFRGEGETDEVQRRIESDTIEHPQGQFLVHYIRGFSLMSWWDRTQGDTRANCNSSLVVEGIHNSTDLHLALLQSFPHVQRNLMRAGVVLREVTR